MQRAELTVRSADGTEIAVDRSGTGPAVVLVDPALGYSGFDSIRGLGGLLASSRRPTRRREKVATSEWVADAWSAPISPLRERLASPGNA
jgi:hypothetical protein